MVSFAHLWKEDTLSDVDVAIRVEDLPDDVLVIPAHQVILSSIPYFWAQVQRWRAGGTGTSATGTDGAEAGTSRRSKRARTSSSSTVEPPKRQRLQVVLNSHGGVSAADQAAAAESVLAAMYDLSGSSSLAPLDALTDTQLLQAVMIADMVQLEATSAQAASLLAKATDLSAAVQQQYMALPSWPQQLLPLFPAMAAGQPLLEVVSTWLRHIGSQADSSLEELQQASLAQEMQAILLQQLGELDHVWSDRQLTDLLLQLPLPAMLLLLSAQDLKVSSEDNVLYTAQAWMDKQPVAEQAAAAAKLAPCIRCLQLSQLWLSALAIAEDAADGVMQTYLKHIKQYYSLQLLGSVAPQQVAADVERFRDSCPRWFLPQRQYTPLPAGGVELQWSLPVSELRDACKQAFRKGAVELESTHSTPPLKGLCWKLCLLCLRGMDNAVTVDLRVWLHGAPTSSCIMFSFDLSDPTASRTAHMSLPLTSDECVCYKDFLRLGAMADGWDAVAWVNKGLPTQGDLLLKLKVHDVWP